MQNSFIFYRSFFEATLPLNDIDKLILFQAITDYALNGKETELTPIPKAMFTLIKPQLDANKTRFENGSKGGRPKTEPKPKDNRKITGAEPNKNLNLNSNLNSNLNLNKNERVGSALKLYEFCLSGFKEEDRPAFMEKPDESIPDTFGDEWVKRKGKADDGMFNAWGKFYRYYTSSDNKFPERSDWETMWINWLTNERIYAIQKK